MRRHGTIWRMARSPSRARSSTRSCRFLRAAPTATAKAVVSTMRKNYETIPRSALLVELGKRVAERPQLPDPAGRERLEPAEVQRVREDLAGLSAACADGLRECADRCGVRGCGDRGVATGGVLATDRAEQPVAPARDPSRPFAPETAPQAGKLLLRLNVVRTRRATIKARAACRRPAQQFS